MPHPVAMSHASRFRRPLSWLYQRLQSPLGSSGMPRCPKNVARLAVTLGLALSPVGAAWGQSPEEASIPAVPVPVVATPESSAPDGSGPSMAQTSSRTPLPTPPLPTPLPEAVVPPQGGIVGLSPGPTEDLGIGLLQPQNLSFLEGPNGDGSPLAYGRWLRSVALPLYVSPNGDPWGWIVNGWLIINGYEPLAIGQDASFSMVEARPGLYSFPVLEQRPDGWFRFQYTAAGSAWAHRDHLQEGTVHLTIQPWEVVLSTTAQLRFRRHGLFQSLRTDPGATASLRSLVVPNSRIRPLALAGDWMQVEVTQPMQGCTALPGHSVQTGWLRWRDDTQTLLVWPVTPPCLQTAPE